MGDEKDTTNEAEDAEGHRVLRQQPAGQGDEEGRAVGSAVYDATMGGANFGKFGPTSGKIAPLVSQLFS